MLCRNAFISPLLNGNYDTSLTMLQDSVTAWVLFIGPFLIGFILILVIWPFLCCCCVCPSCCPSKCCQKKDEDLYTKCELIWPGVVLIVALLLACVASIVGIFFFDLGFTRAEGLSNGINNVLCTGFILFDDFNNGNVTEDGQSFFVGITTLGR